MQISIKNSVILYKSHDFFYLHKYIVIYPCAYYECILKREPFLAKIQEGLSWNHKRFLIFIFFVFLFNQISCHQTNTAKCGDAGKINQVYQIGDIRPEFIVKFAKLE